MKNNILVSSASDIGRRHDNHDRVHSDSLRWKRSDVGVLVVCDGVGSNPLVGKHAQRVLEATLQATLHILKNSRKKSLRSINSDVLNQVRAKLENGGRTNVTCASTMALAIVRRAEALFIWAGDSRAWVLDERGNLHQQSHDDHALSGALKTYINGAGKVAGSGLRSCRFDGKFTAVVLTSDGVHNSCRHNELEEFIQYQVQIGKGKDLQRDLKYFLQANFDDNYSMALALNPATRLKPALRKSISQC